MRNVLSKIVTNYSRIRVPVQSEKLFDLGDSRRLKKYVRFCGILRHTDLFLLEFFRALFHLRDRSRDL